MVRAAFLIGPVTAILLSAALAGSAPAPADPPSVAATLAGAARLLQAGRSHEALRALEPVETWEPDNPWLAFYRGTAYLQLGDPYQAMRDYDRSLDALAALGDPDPALAEKVRLHRRRARQQVFSLSLQTGLAFDTNVTYLGESDLGTADQISGEEDGKFASQFRIDYAPIASPIQTLAFGARLDHAWHFAVEQFDYQDYGAYLRYARRIGRNWEAELRYDYDVTFLGNEPFLSNRALTPALTYCWEPSDAPFRLDRSRVHYEFAARDFLFDTTPEFDRDGPAHAVGFEQSFLFNPHPQWTWELAAGYRYTSISTEGSEFDRGTHDFHLGLGVPLVNPADPQKYLIIPDKELMFRFNVQWHLGRYRARSLLDHGRHHRSDLITSYAWSLSQKLVEDPEWGDLTLHTIIHWTDADSNVTVHHPMSRFVHSSPFTYDKVVYGIQLEWSW